MSSKCAYCGKDISFGHFCSSKCRDSWGEPSIREAIMSLIQEILTSRTCPTPEIQEQCQQSALEMGTKWNPGACTLCAECWLEWGIGEFSALKCFSEVSNG